MESAVEEESLIKSTLDSSFKATCRILFGKEVGGMREFEKYLSQYLAPMKKAKSFVTGKDVYFQAPYPSKAKFADLSEKSQLSEVKVPVNDLKDIDSVLQAVAGIASYCGNKVIGHSSHVFASDNIADSHYVYKSHEILKSEHIACTDLTINSKRLFGCSSCGESEFAIGVTEVFRLSRAFECAACFYSSDLCYCYYMKGCRDCMFSFNQNSKSFMIGNNQMDRAKYGEVKNELLRQIADELEGKKSIASLGELAGGAEDG